MSTIYSVRITNKDDDPVDPNELKRIIRDLKSYNVTLLGKTGLKNTKINLPLNENYKYEIRDIENSYYTYLNMYSIVFLTGIIDSSTPLLLLVLVSER
jgi:hypothetical protein